MKILRFEDFGRSIYEGWIKKTLRNPEKPFRTVKFVNGTRVKGGDQYTYKYFDTWEEADEFARKNSKTDPLGLVQYFAEPNEDFVKESMALMEGFSQNMEKVESCVRNRFQCVIDYRGERLGAVQDGLRLIEPYTVGVNSLGNTVLRAWMVRGASKSGRINASLIPGWRIYRLDRVRMVNPTLTKFNTPRKNFNPADSNMTEVFYYAAF
jgi:hypothetical protein